MSSQQYIKDQAAYFSSKGSINEKNEIVASPSRLPLHKGKTEEQILYEHLKEKRGVSPLNHNRRSESSILEEERPELLNKRSSDRSLGSMEEPRVLVREQNGLRPKNAAELINNMETKRPGVDFSPKKDSEGRVDNPNDRESHIERKGEVEARPKVQEDGGNLKVNEEKRAKTASKLLERLNRPKAAVTNVAEKPKTEVNAGLAQSQKIEKPNGNLEEHFKNVDKEDRVVDRAQGDFDIMTTSFSSIALERSDYFGEKNVIIEDQKSLMSQVIGPSKKIAPEKEPNPKMINEESETQNYNKPSKRDFLEKRVNSSNQDMMSSRIQPAPDRASQEKEDNILPQERIQEQRGSGIKEKELQERREEEYIPMSRVNEIKDGNEVPMKQSQISRGSKQKGVEELEFDEIERESVIRQHDEQMKAIASRSTIKSAKEEDIREDNSKSRYLSKKGSQEYVERRVSEYGYGEQDFSGGIKFPNNEKSISETNEKRVEKSEKGEARSMMSYAKNTEKLVKMLLGKMEKMEENQMEMMRIIRRQGQEIERLRRVYGDEEEEEGEIL